MKWLYRWDPTLPGQRLLCICPSTVFCPSISKNSKASITLRKPPPYTSSWNTILTTIKSYLISSHHAQPFVISPTTKQLSTSRSPQLSLLTTHTTTLPTQRHTPQHVDALQPSINTQVHLTSLMKPERAPPSFPTTYAFLSIPAL